MNEMDLNTARRLARDMNEAEPLEGDDAGYIAVSIDDMAKLIKLLGPTTNCILECDSPSIPPEPQEYLQCGCADCLKRFKTEKFPMEPTARLRHLASEAGREADRRRPRRRR